MYSMNALCFFVFLKPFSKIHFPLFLELRNILYSVGSVTYETFGECDFPT